MEYSFVFNGDFNAGFSKQVDFKVERTSFKGGPQVPVSSMTSKKPLCPEIPESVPALNFKRNIDLKTEDINICGIMSSDNMFALVGHKNMNRILVFENYDFKSQIVLDHKPWGCSLIPSTDRAVITSYFSDDLQFVDLKKGMFIKKVKVDKSSGGGVVATREKLYVGTKTITDNNCTCICVLSADGCTKYDYIKINNINDEILQPKSMTFCAGRICFIDQKNVHFIYTNGEIMFSYNLPKNVSPLYITANNGVIYIVTDNNGVHALSIRGKLLQTLFSVKGDRMKPVSLAFGRRLYTTCKSGSGYVVKVYDVQ